MGQKIGFGVGSAVLLVIILFAILKYKLLPKRLKSRPASPVSPSSVPSVKIHVKDITHTKVDLKQPSALQSFDKFERMVINEA